MSAGTGQTCRRRGTLSEYLLLAVHTVCGYGGERATLSPTRVVDRSTDVEEQVCARLPVCMGHANPVAMGSIVVSAAGLQTGLVPTTSSATRPTGSGHCSTSVATRSRLAVNAKVRARMERLELLVSLRHRHEPTAELSHVVSYGSSISSAEHNDQR